MPKKICHLPSTSTKIKSCAAVDADLQHSLKGVDGGDQECGTVCSGKTWKNMPSYGCFQIL